MKTLEIEIDKKIEAAFKFEIKQVGERTLQFIGSNEMLDRDREILSVDGWDLKNYKKNPVFLFAHDYSQPPIGKSVNTRVKDGQLLFDIEFAAPEVYPFADTVFKLYKGGFMKATSVGFLPKQWVYGDGSEDFMVKFTKQELLELSAVPVPANPSAVLQERGLLEAWKKDVISDKEWDEFSAKIKQISEKGNKNSDIQELQNKLKALALEVGELNNLIKSLKSESELSIKGLQQQIELLSDKSYISEILRSGQTPTETPSKLILEGLKTIAKEK